MIREEREESSNLISLCKSIQFSKKRAQNCCEKVMLDQTATLRERVPTLKNDSLKRRIRSSILTTTEIDEEIYFLCSTMDENSKQVDLMCKPSFGKTKEDKQESILSTAESHLTNRLKHVTGRELRSSRPKANSSPRILTRSSEINQSLTFNVDYASTPKKNQPRASTPSRVCVTKVPAIMRTLPHKKTIPPPLLSSSMRPSASSSETKNKRKRCTECCCCCTNECVRSAGEKMTRKKLRRRTSLDHNSSSLLHKYPVRFMLDRRTQDINRCNPVDDALISCDLRPFLKNCYAFGDYNVWIL